jgi:hypothetical protein
VAEARGTRPDPRLLTQVTPMRSLLRLALLLLALLPAAPLAAQTTGFPLVNDLTINGSFPGSTSCNFVNALGLPTTYQLSSTPNSPCILIIQPQCPCMAGSLPQPPVTCPFPMLQSIDLSPLCPILVLPGVTDAAGNFTLNLPAVTTPFRFAIQGAVLHASCLNVLWTQAYTVLV